MGLIEDVTAKCNQIQDQAEFVKTLAGKASDPKWVEVDPGYTRLKAMATLAADKVVTLANELKALIPP